MQSIFHTSKKFFAVRMIIFNVNKYLSMLIFLSTLLLSAILFICNVMGEAWCVASTSTNYETISFGR